MSNESDSIKKAIITNDWQIIQETPTRVRVSVDGIELRGVRNVSYSNAIDETPIIRLEIMPGAVNRNLRES